MDIKSVMTSAVDASSMEGINQLENKTKNAKDVEKVKKLASDFESMFMEQMLKSMRSSVQKSGLIDGGNAEDIYTSMLDSEYAKAMGGKGSNGIADMVERQLLESMGVKSVASNGLQLKRGLSSYAQNDKPALQDGQKKVTMESRANHSAPTIPKIKR
jgi:peptidoglycan hydrolase FlgJ